MPIQIIWGNDTDACNKAIEKIINCNISKNWISLNLSKFNGDDINQVFQAFEEIETPPLGEGSRVVLLKNNPIFNIKNETYAKKYETNLSNIPKNNFLILQNILKPDSRIKTTKLLKSLINEGIAIESSFNLPDMWNRESQLEYIQDTAKNMNFILDKNVSQTLLDTIGIDSLKLVNELEKAKLYLLAKNKIDSSKIFLTNEDVKNIFNDHQSNIFKILDCIFNENIAEGLIEINYLLNKGESPLKLTAGLISQVRSHTIVFLLKGEKDLMKISKLANISNPKRIFYMRKKIKSCSANYLIELMIKLLNIESLIKKGNNPINVFTENLINLS